MQLTPEQILKISLVRKQYLAAFEKWSQSPENFSVLVEAMGELAKVKKECLGIIAEAAQHNGIRVDEIKFHGHDLFSAWRAKHHAAKYARLERLVESALLNKQCLQAKASYLCVQPHIDDLSVVVKDGVFRHVIRFVNGDVMTMGDLNDAHKYEKVFADLTHRSLVRIHCETYAKANM